MADMNWGETEAAIKRARPKFAAMKAEQLKDSYEKHQTAWAELHEKINAKTATVGCFEKYLQAARYAMPHWDVFGIAADTYSMMREIITDPAQRADMNVVWLTFMEMRPTGKRLGKL